MYAKSYGVHISHHQVEILEVEVHLGQGLPMMVAMGNLSTRTKEGIYRVRTALTELGIKIPPKRITINISPAKLYKTSTSLDLPICMALLGAMGIYPKEALRKILFVGEVGLSGKLKPAEYMGYVKEIKEREIEEVIFPKGQVIETSQMGVNFYEVSHLKEILGDFQDMEKKLKFLYKPKEGYLEEVTSSLAYIKGQEASIKGLAIAMAGKHPCILIGAPGVGKSMIARNSLSLMPPLEKKEQREVQQIYQGRKDYEGGVPFRIPDTAISYSSMFGGGAYPKPGEVSLAHRGILLLEEMTDFKSSILRGLRAPLEEKKIKMIRKMETYEYPADFLLIGTMNFCECSAPTPQRCICTPKQKERYKAKLSHSLLDRIHMVIDVKKPSFEALQEEEINIEKIKEQILLARARQKERDKKGALMHLQDFERVLNLGDGEKSLLAYLYEEHQFSVRTYIKFLKLIRTIGDMEGAEKIKDIHIMEALLYQNYMEGDR